MEFDPLHIKTSNGLSFLEIPELGFFGNVKFSRNGEFAVGFADSCMTKDGFRGGFRESGEGSVLLAHNGRVLWKQMVERPAEANVSNRGDVVVCDLGFGTGLKSTLKIFDVHGQQRVAERIHANSFSCALTPQGDYALFNSCAAAFDAHSCKLFVFSVSSGSQLFTADFPIQIITRAECDGDLIVVATDDLDYRFSIDGNLTNALEIDAQLFHRAVTKREYITAYYVLKTRKDAVPVTDESRSFLIREYAELSTIAPSDLSAKCFRDWGLLLLEAGEKDGAAEKFRQALMLNPRIGLKRKLAGLEGKSAN